MQAADTNHMYPHVELCELNGVTEAYIPGTGLAIWEFAWVARLYDSDVDATAEHLGQSHEIIDEALRYANDHAAEIEEAIQLHTEGTLEELSEILPGLRVIDIDPSEHDLPHA
jgi:hypothetical protein